MLGHAAGHPFAARAILPGTESGVTAHLPPVLKARPVADLAGDDDAESTCPSRGAAPRARRLPAPRSGPAICACRGEQRRPIDVPSPARATRAGPSEVWSRSAPPPVRRRGLTVTHEQPAALGLELRASRTSCFALPVRCGAAFLLLARHPDHGQFLVVALEIAREPLAERARIAARRSSPPCAASSSLRGAIT